MPQSIHKLQPNRTIQLRGFDSFGAAAAMHGATANSFNVTGVFRDAADFAVLVLYDADNFYEHSRLKYLPNFDFNGLTLQFDVHYEGLRPLDSPRYVTIDWPYLDVVKNTTDPDNTARIRLSDHATLVAGTHAKAATTFTIEDNGLKEYDRVTLWYMNFAFDYLVPKVECAYAIEGGGAGTIHRITVAGVDYTYTETATDTNTSIAVSLAAIVDAAPQINATTGPAGQINLRNQWDNEQSYTVSSSASANQFTLFGIGRNSVAANLAWQINSVNWTALQVPLPLQASAANGVVTIECAAPGEDGNAITMYSVAKNNQLLATTANAFAPLQYKANFTGGSSDCTWRVTLDFAALGVPSIRQMWLTFAPPLPDGAALTDTEWKAEFTNWTLLGPAAKRELLVAGPDSVRVEEDSAWCTYTGLWDQLHGFYSGAYCRTTSTLNHAVEIFYASNRTHDLYLGTTLFHNRGIVTVTLDSDSPTEHNLAVASEALIHTRRLLRTNVPPGRHTVTIRLTGPGIFDFDFLEAAVPEPVPDALPARDHVSPALDYSTDHTFKLPPARIHWIFDQLGFTGPMNEYIGVFWWNQRRRVNAIIPQAIITIGGTYEPNDQVILSIGGTPVGKTVFPNESNALIAHHLAWFINTNLVGVYAEPSGDTLTITSRSPTSNYSYTLTASTQSANGTVSLSGSLSGGDPGRWDIDVAADPPLNRAARDWHADFCAEANVRSRELTIACSMELVNPPLEFAAYYPDNKPVITDVGFAGLKSTHCTFNSHMREYQKRVYANIAAIQHAAGLTPSIQFGEFLWWFFTNQTASNPNGGMGLYDAENQAEALSALGRPLHIFRKPTDNPNINNAADAIFLRNKLRDHIAALRTHVQTAFANTKFELLYPYDVNHPVPAGVHLIGGALNHFINLPIEYHQKPGSGLDTLKMEALDFGAWSRSLDLSKTAIQLPSELGWPLDSIRYLVPVFRGGAAWQKEYLEAKGLGIPVINFWAQDHFNLYNLDCREPIPFATATRSV
jgi:hypothetical protein